MIDMKYDIKDKMEWTVIFILEFGHKYGMSMKEAFDYLSHFKAIDFIDRHYDYVHTQSFTSMVSGHRLSNIFRRRTNLIQQKGILKT